MKRTIAAFALGAGLSIGTAFAAFAVPSKVIVPGAKTTMPTATGSTATPGQATRSNGSRGGSGGGSSYKSSKNAAVNSSAGTWQKDARGWWLSYGAGNYAKNTWVQKDSKWYHFNAEGYMETSWRYINDKWYYMHDDGHMNTGWLLTGGKWYYCDESGAMWHSTTTPDGYQVNDNGEYVAK